MEGQMGDKKQCACKNYKLQWKQIIEEKRKAAEESRTADSSDRSGLKTPAKTGVH